MKLNNNFNLPRFGRIDYCTLLLLAAIFFLSTIYACQPLNGGGPNLTPPAGADLFRNKCSKCHAPEVALQENRTPELWRATITRMKDEHGADIDNKEIELLVKYHVERQQQEAALFQEKCEKCHPGKIFLEKKLTQDQARSIIRRMQEKAGNTIEDKDIEIIVRYHVQAQNAAVKKNLQAITRKIVGNQPPETRNMILFVEKCSGCHNPARALSVLKDPQVWALTIKRMQAYSQGTITDDEAEELVAFHVDRQQQELNTFQDTCTRCHDDERINNRSMSDEEWLATIRRMQQKAPDLITDEKVNLLAAYFHRRELTLARIFAGKCELCHLEGTGVSSPFGASSEIDSLVVLAKAEFGQSLQISDVNNLISVHVQRQKRNMRLFEKCSTCHARGIPGRTVLRQEAMDRRSRAEWVSFIAALQGVELTREVQNTINSQINYHINKYQTE